TDHKPIEFEEQSSVWLYKYFSKSTDPSDPRIRKLATHWHGPYRVHRRLGPNTYQIEVPTHPDKLVTVNVDRLKPFRGYYSRPYNDDVPQGDDEQDDLTLDCLPNSSFVDLVSFPDDDVAYTNSGSPIYRIVDKRREPGSRETDYLVEHVDGSKYWNPLSKLSEYRSYVDDYESQLRMDRGLPPLRRSPRFRDLDIEPKNDTQF
ncbi:unnamed protein product, partial [Aphanomyces euteiches]